MKRGRIFILFKIRVTRYTSRMTDDPTAPPTDSDATTVDDFQVLQRVITALTPLSPEARRRVFEAAALFLQIDLRGRDNATALTTGELPPSSPTSRSPFSEDTSMSVKEFLLDKQPKTDVERIACLAYYLTHYRGTPHFKTVDLSMLNTEAAQPKFSNATVAAINATATGYLAPSTKGQRQLSAAGERFVRALPDRDAARAALESIRRKPRTRRSRKNSTPQET
jgi:hypothetical protein